MKIGMYRSRTKIGTSVPVKMSAILWMDIKYWTFFSIVSSPFFFKVMMRPVFVLSVCKTQQSHNEPIWFCIICQGCEETTTSWAAVWRPGQCPTGGAVYCEKLMRTMHERFKSEQWETQNKELSFRSFWKLQEITFLFYSIIFYSLFFSFLWKYPVKIQPKYKRCWATFKTIKNTHRSGSSNSPSVLFIHSLGTECLTVSFHSGVWAFGNR